MYFSSSSCKYEHEDPHTYNHAQQTNHAPQLYNRASRPFYYYFDIRVAENHMSGAIFICIMKNQDNSHVSAQTNARQFCVENVNIITWLSERLKQTTSGTLIAALQPRCLVVIDVGTMGLLSTSTVIIKCLFVFIFMQI